MDSKDYTHPPMADNHFSDAFKGKKVFITGHTGFKGSWMSLWLREIGADVYGYALPRCLSYSI
jgi:hypothetical protein